MKDVIILTVLSVILLFFVSIAHALPSEFNDLSVSNDLSVWGQGVFNDDASVASDLTVSRNMSVDGTFSAVLDLVDISNDFTSGGGTFTSNSYVDLGPGAAPDLSITTTIEHADNPIIIDYDVTATNSGSNNMNYFILEIDGSDITGTESIETMGAAADYAHHGGTWSTTQTAGTHDFTVQCKTQTGTLTVNDGTLRVIEFKERK